MTNVHPVAIDRSPRPRRVERRRDVTPDPPGEGKTAAAVVIGTMAQEAKPLARNHKICCVDRLRALIAVLGFTIRARSPATSLGGWYYEARSCRRPAADPACAQDASTNIGLYLAGLAYDFCDSADGSRVQASQSLFPDEGGAYRKIRCGG